MNCPNCGGLQYCPCEPCRKQHKQEVVWIDEKNGEIKACGHCGYKLHADGWAEEELKQLKLNEDDTKPEN